MDKLAQSLLNWYGQNRRRLPFREEPTPYRVWVSEIMLQQTRMETALPYFERFMAALPDIQSLAAVGEDELHKLWQGLGYYNRARNLQKAAVLVVQRYGGELPADYAALCSLPGIGSYTAGAIASIAFGLPEVAVDGNVLRVFSRLLASEGDIGRPEVKRALSAEVRAALPPEAPGDFNQALMELGALVCVPGTPDCAACPLGDLCEGRRLGIKTRLPVIAAKKPKLECPICLLILHDEMGRVLLHRRPAKGLLAGLYEPLLLEGGFTKPEAEKHLDAIFPSVSLGAPLPEAKHVFTHRIWHMYGWQGRLPEGIHAAPLGYVRASAREINELYAIPGAFKTYLPFLTGGNDFD